MLKSAKRIRKAKDPKPRETPDLSTLSPKESRKAVLGLAWPVLLELLLASLFGMLDMIMLGQLPDKHMSAAAVASVGITNQPLFLGFDLIQAFNVGGTAIIARYFGAGRRSEISSVIKHVLILSALLLALPYSILGVAFAKEIMVLMGAQTDTLSAGINYFRIMMGSFIFQALTFALSAALRGVGETRIPMRVNIIANSFNVFGNAILIYGLLGFPALGVVGAAVSTALSKVISCVLLFYHVIYKAEICRLNLKEPFHFSKKTMSNLIQIGIPAAGERLVMRLGIILYTRIVSGLGTAIYAAHQTALNILSLSFAPGNAFSIAASALVGQSLGRKSSASAEKAILACQRYGAVVAFFLGLIFFFFAPQICRSYNNNEIVYLNAAMALRIIAFNQPFQASTLIYSGALRGAGDTFFPMLASTITILGLRVILASVFVKSFGFGLIGAWAATFIDQFIRFFLILWRVRQGKWKHIKIR